ncbi:hypothetical protein PRIEUP_LOCUS997, partial [Pristimantis euphronides]
MIMEQENLIFAFPGDTVTIAARFSLKNQPTTPNVTECDVFKSRYRQGCGNERTPGTCTRRMNENILYFKIHNINQSHNGNYCYSIKVSEGGSNYTGRANIGSQLLILGQSSGPKINQPNEVEISGPVLINCSFSIHEMLGNRSVLWTQVYWMVGDPREHYVYHPNPDYIHPDYSGKTKLVGQSDLLLEDFHGPDNTTLYCRVAVTFCSAMNERKNPIDTFLVEGPGTVLRVLGTCVTVTASPPSDY